MRGRCVIEDFRMNVVYFLLGLAIGAMLALSLANLCSKVYLGK